MITWFLQGHLRNDQKYNLEDENNQNPEIEERLYDSFDNHDLTCLI